jgi:hypothetical protein
VPGSWWRWETSVQTSWYVTNRVGWRVTYYAKAIRGHWGIESVLQTHTERKFAMNG